MLSNDEIKDIVTRLTADLVRIPSQAGVDPVDDIVNLVAARLADQKLNPRVLADEQGRDVGVYARLPPARRARWGIGRGDSGRSDGPRLCLNACIDTAPIGDPAAWSHRPFSADQVDGRLYGRGSADSKAGCAMFLTLAGEFWREGFPRSGTLDVLFDADEHTGRFGGIKAYIAEAGKPDAVAIGYPGNDRIITGARGFLRAVITTHGRAEHSGRSDKKAPGADRKTSNAILKMIRVVSALNEQVLPDETDSDFSTGPKLSITAISGGEGFSQIPDRCACNVDVRLTPHFQEEDARDVVKDAVGRAAREAGDRVEEEGPNDDGEASDGEPNRSSQLIRIKWLDSWPSYRLAKRDPFVLAFQKAVSHEFGHELPTAISGASNIGNYLKKNGVPALCGFGASYQNLHAADEFIEIDTIVPTYRTYREAVRRYLGDHASRYPAGRR